MKGLFNELERLGISISEFERHSGVTYNTLRKMHDGGEVRKQTLGKVKYALKATEEQVRMKVSKPISIKTPKVIVRKKCSNRQSASKRN
jgi:predicted transcriptional regulator